MSIWESFKIALSSIWNHKIRSILTMLGIIIGVAAVITIVAIGQGAQTQLTDELFSTDKNAIELFYEQNPSEDGSEMMWMEPELTHEDIETLAKVPGVKAVLATNQGWGSLVYNDKQGDMEITGVGPEYFAARNIKIVEGRPINVRDNDGMNRIIMIDTVARKKFFKENENVIGEIVDLNDNPYKIVGVYESPTPEQFRHSENGEMLMPRALISLMFGNREIERLAIIASDPDKISETGHLAADTLTKSKKLEDGKYNIFDYSQFEGEFNQFILIITLFIGSVAGISLLVGGIGVMNIMLVSVTERTREIGLRKALGATRGKILLQFLIESVTLTSLGGLIGLGLAILGTLLISELSPITATISPLVVVIGIGFSAFIGVVFGILPASKASKLSPIDALRYE
ncbi:ABC transporter permease [Lederbergia wuyishanensis]|uniref:ABC transport system permease protein n=1 Tax=Lederbergia wuyishanensis TaxID=1347903 RepID=A0ABU0D5P6_9BACI|nr:ABC transporter permease [Lederbergia wuyishanensis]MCJ8008308.1 ABC transporter permease [Lederbergia wuyishanensis]MDQ0343720.1 putative ABC transport system permease protein [Lederbergia wuyishanensis]